MDYQVKRNDGKLISYKLVGHNVVPVEVKMYEYRLILLIYGFEILNFQKLFDYI